MKRSSCEVLRLEFKRKIFQGDYQVFKWGDCHFVNSSTINFIVQVAEESVPTV
jgi:hypothetical protein